MKVATWNGCKDCPYRHCDSKDWNLWSCTHGEFPLLDGKVDGLDAELPETPHPNCKLNDLPTEEDVKYESNNISFLTTANYSFKEGANYVLKEITK